MSVRSTEMSENGTGRRMDTRDVTIIAVCTAMMVICSWISIPATVPFTMQTFGVFLCVGLLGGRRGTLAVSVYLLLGAVGLPVFSGFTGGIGHLFGATGGYIIGFLFSALVMWLIEHLLGRNLKTLVLSMIAGLITCYAFGTAWFMVVYAKDSGSVGLMTALGWCVFPYVVPDAVKIGLATVITRRVRQITGM